MGISRFVMWSVVQCSETQCSQPLAKGEHSRIDAGEVLNLCVNIWSIPQSEGCGVSKWDSDTQSDDGVL